jgi:hypothetical protein
MSGSRGDLHKAGLRREGIRREKHEQGAANTPRDAAPPFVNPHPNAMERSMREMHAREMHVPMEGLQLRSVEEAEARRRVPAC